jgi:hypothetical protein
MQRASRGTAPTPAQAWLTGEGAPRSPLRNELQPKRIFGYSGP